MESTPFLEKHIDKVVAAWNSWMEPDFNLDERLLRQVTFQHPSWRWSRSVIAWEDGLPTALLVARDHEQYIVVDALLVAPERRRQGVASHLLSNLGKRAIRFGGGPSHFLPGIPDGWEAGEQFLKHHEFEVDYRAEDLYCHLGTRKGPFTSTLNKDREQLLDMVRADFSQRWTNDTLARFQAGDFEDVIILKEKDEIVAFCHTWHFESTLLGPSVFWLRNNCRTFGGIGPVGVKKSHRGLGLGRDLMEQALNYLAHRGATEVVVDWTEIGDFYRKFGFESWKRYAGYHRAPRRLIGQPL